MAFTPDQTRLIEVPAGDRGAPRIWNLAEIRKELSHRGLDWPADVLKVLPARIASTSSAEVVVTLDEGNLRNQQAAAVLIREAGNAKDFKARERLERAIKLDPSNAAAHNTLAWILATGDESLRDPQAAVKFARHAVELDGKQAGFKNTLGIALYRDGQYLEAIKNLDESLHSSGEAAAAYDLIFLSHCHDRLGHAMDAADYHERATSWLEKHRSSLSPLWLAELTAFLAEK